MDYRRAIYSSLGARTKVPACATVQMHASQLNVQTYENLNVHLSQIENTETGSYTDWGRRYVSR